MADSPSQPFKLVVFDFDGTLADSFPWLVGIFGDLAEQYRFKRVSQAELAAFRTFPITRIMKSLGVSIWKAPQIGRAIRRRMAAEIERVSLFEGVEELLATLTGRGVRLALMTSNARMNIEKVLGMEHLACFQFLDCNVSLNGKCGRLRKLLAASGLQKGDLLYVGDELRDLAAAHRAGIAFGAVSWGYTDIRALEAQTPEYVFHTLSEIADII